MAKPITVVTNVWLAFSQMPGQYSMRAAAAWLGAGRTKDGILNRRHTNSQSANRPTVVSHGLASNSAFFQFMARPSRGQYARADDGHSQRRRACISFPIREVAADRSDSGRSPGRGAMK